MKGLFIINPNSGGKKVHRKIPAVLDLLLRSSGNDAAHVYYTHKKGDAIETARGLRPGQYDYVCAVGGDGTLNEVSLGLYLGGSGIPMAILSLIHI